MSSTFTEQWSNALGINLAAVSPTQEGLQRVSQAMCDFLQLCTANATMDKINAELNSLQHFGENLRLSIDYGNGMQVNDDTKMLKDAFSVQAVESVKGTWPQAWGDELKTSLLLFAGYSAAVNALSKSPDQPLNLDATLPLLISSYIKDKGIDALRVQADSLEQFLPNVLKGTAIALFKDDMQGLDRFSKNLHEFTKERSGDAVKPLPSVFLEMLLEARTEKPQVDGTVADATSPALS